MNENQIEGGPVRYKVDPMLHQGLVYRFANQYRRSGRVNGLDRDDLIQHGNIGLLRACELFDESLDIQFSSYASIWIKNSIIQLIITYKFIKIPIHVQAHRRKVGRTAATVGRLHGWDRSESEASELPVADVKAIDPADAAARGDEMAALRRAVGRLGEPHREVIRRSHEVAGTEFESLTDIARRMGCSRERVRQLKEKGLEMLRLEMVRPGGSEWRSRVRKARDKSRPIESGQPDTEGVEVQSC